MPTLTVMLGSSYLGETRFDGEIVNTAGIPLHESLAYFDPLSGEVWARLILSRGKSWQVLVRPLAEEGYTIPERIPGSLILPWYPRLTDLLPEAAIRREASLCLAYYERFHHERFLNANSVSHPRH